MGPFLPCIVLYFQCLKDPNTECLLVISSLNEEMYLSFLIWLQFFSPLVSLGVAEKYLLWAPRESKARMMHPVSTFDPVYQAMVDLLSVPLSAIPTEMWREDRPPMTVFPGVAENVDLEAACPGLGLQLRHSL